MLMMKVGRLRADASHQPALGRAALFRARGGRRRQRPHRRADAFGRAWNVRASFRLACRSSPAPCGVLSNVRVRNVATVGGRLAHGDPHMDLPPVLIALWAPACMWSGRMRRAHRRCRRSVHRLLRDPARQGRTDCRTGHSRRRTASRAVYLKCTTARRATTGRRWASRSRIAADRDGVREAHVVISAATERATRLDKASALLVGQRAERDDCCAMPAKPRPARWTRSRMRKARRPTSGELVRVYVERALRQALELDGGLVQ